MKNLEKYNHAFAQTFNVEVELLKDDFAYQDVPSWDSVGHMGLIASLEEIFEIMLETEDIIEFSTYGVGKQILKKYGVEI